MELPIKCSVISGSFLLFAIVFGWVIFPEIFKFGLRHTITLEPGSEIRTVWQKIPFPVNFEVFIFNVTNAKDVLNGDSPMLDEVGPFVYDEWRSKENTIDNEVDDTVEFNPKMTWFFNEKRSGKLTGDELVTIPHPIILGALLKTYKERPQVLSLAVKAFDVIFDKPETIFLTVKVKDVLFNGVYIDCNHTDFFAKMACGQMESEKNLRKVEDGGFLFSFFGYKNGTLGARMKVKRGVQNSKDINRVIEYKREKKLDVWADGGKCNEFRGTESTIYPPLINDGEDLAAFAPLLCKTMDIKYQEKTSLFDISVSYYNVSLGDMSKNADEKCFCPTNKTCLRKGAVDLTPCVGAPIIITLPHFFDADESYLEGVRGLRPDPSKHGIEFYLEPISGTVLKARSRMQFNFELLRMPGVNMTERLPELLLPVLWVNEGVTLNSSFVQKIYTRIVTVLKVNNVVRWSLIIVSGCALVVSVYLTSHMKRGFSLSAFQVGDRDSDGTAEPTHGKSTMITTLTAIAAGSPGKNRKQYDATT